MTLTKLWNTAYRQTVQSYASIFLLNPFVRRVNRCIPIRKFEFCRSTYKVLTCPLSGQPSVRVAAQR